MSTSLNYLNYSFGENQTNVTGAPLLAPKGATVAVYTASKDAASLAAPMKVLLDYKVPVNKNSQRLTLPTLALSTRNEMVLPVYASHQSLYREAGTTDIRSSKTAYEQVWDEVNGVSMGSFTFSSATNGDEKINLVGEVTCASTGTTLPKKIVSGGTHHDYANVDDAGLANAAIGASDTGPTDVLNGDLTDLPTFKVQSTLPAGASFVTFHILAGQPLPDDETAIYIDSGLPVKFSEMDSLVDADGKLLSDYLVESSKISFIKDFVCDGISLDPNTPVPENLVVSLVASTNSSVKLVDPLDAQTGDVYLFYAYGQSPRFDIHLPNGFHVDQPFELSAGLSWVGGFTLPEETQFSQVDDVADSVQLNQVVLYAGFQVFDGVALESVVPTLAKSSILAGMTSKAVAMFPTGASTESDLHLKHGIMMATESQAPSALTILESTKTRAQINLSSGSELAEGTVLPVGSPSLEGAIVNESLSFDNSSTLTEEYDMTSKFTISQGATLSPGMILRDPTLPIGFVFPANTILPANVRALPAVNHKIEAQAEFPVGTVLGSGFTMYDDIGMAPKGVIPAQSSITGPFTLPAQSKLPAGGVFANTDIPVPVGTVFSKGTVLPVGTIFDEDAQLPADFNIASQLPVVTDVEQHATAPLALIVESPTSKYIRVAPHSGLLSGLHLPKGTVISKRSTGSTVSLDDAVHADDSEHDSAVTLVLDPAEYSLSANYNNGGEVITITAGTPTSIDLYLLADFVSDRELLIPFGGNSNSLGKIKMAAPLVLTQSLSLQSAIKVGPTIPMKWPRGHALAVDFVLSRDTLIGATGVSTYITKDITLDVASTDDYIHGIFSDGCVIKFPPQGYTLTSAIKNSATKIVVGVAGTYKPAKAFIEYPKGARITGELRLISQLKISGQFVINTEIASVPHKFDVEGGIRIPAGSTFPGVVTIPARSPLPKGITLPVAVTLAAKYVVNRGVNSQNNSSIYTLLAETDLAAGSVIAEDSEFPAGHVFNVPVTLAPFTSLRTVNSFAVFGDEELNTSVNYYQFADINDISYLFAMMNFGTSGLIEKVKQLEALLQSVQEQLMQR